MEELIANLRLANVNLSKLDKQLQGLLAENASAAQCNPPESTDVFNARKASIEDVKQLIKAAEKPVNDCVAAIVSRFIWEHPDVGQFKSKEMLNNVWIAWCNQHLISDVGFPSQSLSKFLKNSHLQRISPVNPQPKFKHSALDALLGASKDPARVQLSGICVHRIGSETRIISTDGRRLMTFPMTSGDGIPFPYIKYPKEGQHSDADTTLCQHGGNAPEGQWIWTPVRNADAKLLGGLTDADAWKHQTESWHLGHVLRDLTPEEKARLDEISALPYNLILGGKIIRFFAGRWWNLERDVTFPNYQSVVPDRCQMPYVVQNPVAFLPYLTAVLRWQKLRNTVGDTVVAIRYTEDRNPIVLNATFLFDILRTMQGRGKVKLLITDDCHPIVFDAADGSYSVLMPFRDCENFDNYIFLDSFVSEEQREKFDNSNGSPIAVKKRNSSSRTVPMKVTPTKPVVSKPADALDAKRTSAHVKESVGKSATSPKPAVKTAITDGKFTVTDRVIKNLLFQQPMRLNSKVWISSRLDFIHQTLESGKLAIAKYLDKKGKYHWLINKQFVGKIAYEYAEHLLAGGQRVDASVVSK